MTIIEDIPNEVLEKILAASCDLNYGDLVSAGQTCQRWFSICDNILKKRKAAEIKHSWSTNYHLFLLHSRVICGRHYYDGFL